MTASTSDASAPAVPETWRSLWESWRLGLDDGGGLYYYDADQAQRAVRFIQTFCRHLEGDHAGKPFLLDEWELMMVRDLWGWRRVSDGRKRFSESYCEGPKGCGKTAFASALALFGLCGEGTAGAEVYTVAGNTLQSSIAFAGAKGMSEKHPRLEKAIVRKQFELLHPKSGSKLRVLSGKGEGKHGLKPSLVIGDELHEWAGRDLYDSISSATMKRECLAIWLTNAGVDTHSVCYELRQRAERVLEGESAEESFYPVLFGPVDPDPKHWQNPALWEATHPGIGTTVKLEDIAREWKKAEGTPALLPRNARLYLGVWTQTADSWIRIDKWDACVDDPPADEVLAKLPCYLGLDLSLTDDLTARAAVWHDEAADVVWAKVRQWMPRSKAAEYEQRDLTPYAEWAGMGVLELTEGKVVDHDAVVEDVLAVAAANDVKAVCYDAWRAGKLTNRLEDEGLPCVAVRQSFSGVGPAMAEIERRLKAGPSSLRLPRDPLLRWQAGNLEVKADDAGNVRPVKHAAKGDYAGTRSKKIDGVMALIFALSRVALGGVEAEGGLVVAWA